MVASEAMAKAQLNPYDAYVMAGFEDPIELIKRNLAFEMMAEPTVRRVIAKKALEDWGYDTLELQLELMMDEMEQQKIMMSLQQAMMGDPSAMAAAGGSAPPSGEPGDTTNPQNVPSLPNPVGAPAQGLSTPPNMNIGGI